VDGVHRTTVSQPVGARRAGVFHTEWLSRHLAEVDVVHVLGLPAGTGAAAVSATRNAVAAVRRSGVPLVVTAYHLSDPSGEDDNGFADRMTVLLREADAVLTLTDSAAAEISRRWAMTATVLPHPHVVDFVRMRTPRSRSRSSEPPVVGTHLGSLRLAADPVDFVAALSHAVRSQAGGRLRVHLNSSVSDPNAGAYAPRAVRQIERVVRETGGTVVTHPPLTDGQLWDHLSMLDVSVLPPVHGSHSVWPEACIDLGTWAVLPESHAAGQQSGTLTYPTNDTTDLARALGEALEATRGLPRAPRSDPEDRWNQRVMLCERHRDLFDSLLRPS
jgi:hypothetical protein